MSDKSKRYKPRKESIEKLKAYHSKDGQNNKSNKVRTKRNS